MKIKDMIRRVMPQCMWNGLKSHADIHYEKNMQKKCREIRPFQKGQYPCGVNLIGDIRAETGLGQSMRIVARLLETGKVPFMIRQESVSGDRNRTENEWDSKIEKRNRYSVNILHINNVIWRKNYCHIPAEELDGRYNIAYWLWELEEFPQEWVSCIDSVDEIWTPAQFVSDSIKKRTSKPVMTMPYGMELDKKALLKREYFGLPEDQFLFLVMYDVLSISERKNPQGAIAAYKQAFARDNKECGLIIKINHLDSKETLERLKQELQGYPNIYFITDNLCRKEVESLIAAADVLVSLHRAEGFGLPLAEAMYLGTAVIATNWSAPVEFMDGDSACLVDYQLKILEKDVGPYHKGNRWADADITQAADYMRKLWEDKQYYKNKIACGERHIKESLSMDKMAAKMADRVREICGR